VRRWAGTIALAGCADSGAPGGESGLDTTAGSTAEVVTAASMMVTDPGTSTDGTTSTTPTTTPTASDPTLPSESSSGVGPTDFPVFPPKYCDLETVDPKADPQAVVDAGDEPGQIPTIIGDALLRNCGCHYSDNVVGYVDYMTNETPMATHADFHATFTGIFPMEFEGMPVYLAVEQRVVFMNPLPMPSIECDVEGEAGTISVADQNLFADWLAAGAPDGASYP
jgi:hypothetical protein